jgi:hypothetical protein
VDEANRAVVTQRQQIGRLGQENEEGVIEVVETAAIHRGESIKSTDDIPLDDRPGRVIKATREPIRPRSLIQGQLLNDRRNLLLCEWATERR